VDKCKGPKRGPSRPRPLSPEAKTIKFDLEAPLGQLQHGLEVYTSLRETINHLEEGVRAVSEIIIRVVGGNGFFVRRVDA